MNRSLLGWIALFFIWGGVSGSGAEPLFEDLPFGVFVEKGGMVPADQTAAIGKKLGGKIERLSNLTLKVHGVSIRVNVIEAKSDADAEAIHRSISGMKTNRVLCVRKGRTVVEYPGNHVDPATATKTSFELGLVPKSKRVRYRVVADIGAIETADYMAANELFNLFLSPGFRSGDSETLAKIRSLSGGFTFGDTLILRGPGPTDSYTFSPKAGSGPVSAGGGSARFVFSQLPDRAGIPFVTVTMEIEANDLGTRTVTDGPSGELTAATPHWPADDPEIRTLSKRITEGCRSDKEKVDAILEWLAPGRNLKYGGKTGSRWGVKKVLEQRFGHCWDSSDVFVSLARAAGVPCRQVAGWLYGTSGHVWAEYRDAEKWHQVDPTGAGKLDCGIYHIPWFTTEDGEVPILYLSMPQIEVIDRN